MLTQNSGVFKSVISELYIYYHKEYQALQKYTTTHSTWCRWFPRADRVGLLISYGLKKLLRLIQSAF